jgi:gliding motility-associated-like protein
LQSNRTLQTIFWSPSTLTNCNNCPQIHFIADKDTWIFTQAIDDRGCNQTDSLFVRVKESGSVYAPNAFTPNGDNVNDNFYLQGEDGAMVESLFIFDRWGNQVFETHNVMVNDPAAGWNGIFNSQKMNPAVFAYYAKVRLVDQEIVELKGDVTLIR